MLDNMTTNELVVNISNALLWSGCMLELSFLPGTSTSLHRELTVQAAEAGTSLNRLISHKLAT